jgi:hypothetical protein
MRHDVLLAPDVKIVGPRNMAAEGVFAFPESEVLRRAANARRIQFAATDIEHDLMLTAAITLPLTPHAVGFVDNVPHGRVVFGDADAGEVDCLFSH